MKVLNLYSGIGGNRKLWKDVSVTAVEIDSDIASVYKNNYPDDNVIVGDAKEFLVNHFKEYDFIWASPPCPTHSRLRTLWKGDGKLNNKTSGSSFKLPDMDLYSVIVFLKHFYEKNWVVENVISYYNPLIKPYVIDNHYFWSNTPLASLKNNTRGILNQDLKTKSEQIDMDIPELDIPYRKKRTMLNNCVKPELGLYIYNCMFKLKQEKIN